LRVQGRKIKVRKNCGDWSQKACDVSGSGSKIAWISMTVPDSFPGPILMPAPDSAGPVRVFPEKGKSAAAPEAAKYGI
jgi:hypothetical protein